MEAAFRQVGDTAPGVGTIDLPRPSIRRNVAREFVDRGHLVDCWTIDHGAPDADLDLETALACGVVQIISDTPAARATVVSP